GYGNLAHWITITRRRAVKGAYLAHPGDVEGKVPNAPMLAGLPGCLALLAPEAVQPFEEVFAQAMWLKTWFQERAAMAIELLHRAGDEALLELVQRVARYTGLPIVAAGDVLMHVRSRKPLQDTLTATRLGRSVADCGHALEANAEAHLRSRQRLAGLYEHGWLEQTLVLAGTCTFSLDELRYEYPQEIVPPGETPTSHLRKLTYAGVPGRFPQGLGEAQRAQIESELALIEQLNYEPYFLTVADIVHWAREQKILCQGRGSAANSLVCYCLGVTEVDPRRATLLFGRFISVERNEPPDIDIDFEHQRREEVIQYIYTKYGRHRAALTAVVISYRPRSALRDVGRALGIDLQRIDSVAKSQQWYDGRRINPERLTENGFDPESPVCRLWAELTQQLIGFPRHLSQHPGGFVIAAAHMAELVPVENAAMPERSVIQWNKDDLDELGLLKVDILALGMLSAIRRALEFIGEKLGREVRMQDIPDDDQHAYDMICAADTVGVFQIESRAQMSMLSRLKPRCYYDLVVQVAIVRPRPIQGGMVHPYLKNRTLHDDEIACPEELKPALLRTKGVPIFQEQVMQIAMLAADFTAGEADALRRAMAAWKRRGGLSPFHERLVGRMVEKGYERDYAERIFKQIEGFGEYGFPESHAAGFALLAYVSSWIKRHHPDAFLAGLLNSQPMGFYAPAQLVRDARQHGVEVLPVDVRCSAAESVLVPA
ncbi:MAG: error-prone DNA polymerase, partial [Pseudomonadota bacterium]|nr:error-prone DNA polymerase [Pseudomonadota bacterium]